MQWVEVSIQTTHAATEAVADVFHSLGAGGVVIEDPLLLNTLRTSGTWELCDIPEQENTEIVVVTAYFPDDSELHDRLAAVEEEFGIKFNMGQVVTMKNVGEMANIIASQVK